VSQKQQKVHCVVLTDSGQTVQCEVLAGIGQTLEDSSGYTDTEETTVHCEVLSGSVTESRRQQWT